MLWFLSTLLEFLCLCIWFSDVLSLKNQEIRTYKMWKCLKQFSHLYFKRLRYWLPPPPWVSRRDRTSSFLQTETRHRYCFPENSRKILGMWDETKWYQTIYFLKSLENSQNSRQCWKIIRLVSNWREIWPSWLFQDGTRLSRDKNLLKFSGGKRFWENALATVNPFCTLIWIHQ